MVRVLEEVQVVWWGWVKVVWRDWVGCVCRCEVGVSLCKERIYRCEVSMYRCKVWVVWRGGKSSVHEWRMVVLMRR